MTDLCWIWAGRDRWATLALVIDCHTRGLLGWHLSRSGKATTASSALEHDLIARFGTLGRVPEPFLLRSDNGWVFTSRDYTALVSSYGLQQEFITPRCPQQNGMVERVIRTLIEQCAHRYRFETLQPREPCHRRLDLVLQPTATIPSPQNEDFGSGIRISRLTCAVPVGQYTIAYEISL